MNTYTIRICIDEITIYILCLMFPDDVASHWTDDERPSEKYNEKRYETVCDDFINGNEIF